MITLNNSAELIKQCRHRDVWFSYRSAWYWPYKTEVRMTSRLHAYSAKFQPFRWKNANFENYSNYEIKICKITYLIFLLTGILYSLIIVLIRSSEISDISHYLCLRTFGQQLLYRICEPNFKLLRNLYYFSLGVWKFLLGRGTIVYGFT